MPLGGLSKEEDMKTDVGILGKSGSSPKAGAWGARSSRGLKHSELSDSTVKGEDRLAGVTECR